jgi:hypothetical protein
VHEHLIEKLQRHSGLHLTPSQDNECNSNSSSNNSSSNQEGMETKSLVVAQAVVASIQFQLEAVQVFQVHLLLRKLVELEVNQAVVRLLVRVIP